MASGTTGLQDGETAQLLDTVDKLRSLGSLSQDISLPQIIVVGQQSSGKSSVLEAISGIPFPVNDGLCTQFATEVILRRSRETKRSASINAIDGLGTRAPSRSDFADRWKNFDISELGKIISEAKECMDLKEHGISQDKLRLEISGPDQDHLTLVDLPGLIVNARLSQSDDTVDSIRKLVVGYMRQPLSTILAVVSGQADLENQGILGLIKKLDDGNKIRRTLGVITQPDTINAGTVREKTFVALAENEEFPLALDWHVLRNLSSKEKEDNKDRLIVEQDFFGTASPWCNLPAHKVGVTALKKRLSKILLSEIASQLGNILTRIEKVIGETALSLDKLGDERVTSEQQRAFLIKIGDQYKQLVSSALEGEYHDEFFEQYTHRLRACIANENITFADIMTNQAHRWDISSRAAPLVFASGNQSSAQTTARKQLIEHVQNMQQSYRGNELHGMFPVGLVSRLFKEQACYWKGLAVAHVATVFNYVKQFLKDLLRHVAESEVAWTLLEHLIDPEMDRKERLLSEKVDELLHPYLVAHPVTLNPRYIKSLTQARKEWQPAVPVFGNPSPNVDMLACEQVIDIMDAYYDIALSVFVDNVAPLAIESCLLSDLPQLISPVSIAKESSQRLAVLGSEAPEIASTRLRLRRKLHDYEEGRVTIRQHVQRHARLAGQIADKATLSKFEGSGEADQAVPIEEEVKDSTSVMSPGSNGHQVFRFHPTDPAVQEQQTQPPIRVSEPDKQSMRPLTAMSPVGDKHFGDLEARYKNASPSAKPFGSGTLGESPASMVSSSHSTPRPTMSAQIGSFGSGFGAKHPSPEYVPKIFSKQASKSKFDSDTASPGFGSSLFTTSSGFGSLPKLQMQSSDNALGSVQPSSNAATNAPVGFPAFGSSTTTNKGFGSDSKVNTFGTPVSTQSAKKEPTTPTPAFGSSGFGTPPRPSRQEPIRLSDGTYVTWSMEEPRSHGTNDESSSNKYKPRHFGKPLIILPGKILSQPVSLTWEEPNGITSIVCRPSLEGLGVTNELSYEEAHLNDWHILQRRKAGL